MKVVVGLGNPGEQYAKTRHNVGWMTLDRLADRAGWAGRGRTRDASSVVQGRYRGLDLVLAKPLTYMNDSGIAVRKLIARERAPLHEVLVVTDDFSLPFGKMRFREGGSHGGHNGLRSIIDELHTEAFPRLRIGIGEPGRDAVDHVLSVFAPGRAPAPRRAPRRGRRRRRGLGARGRQKAANRFNAFQLRPADETRTAPAGEVDGPPGPDGVRRTRTGWRRVRPADEER